MKKGFINIYADLGMDCMGCGHDLNDGIAVEITDESAEALAELGGGMVDELEGSLIEEQLPEIHEDLDWEARSGLHELMVIQGWEEHGWNACTNYIDELMEEDIENGDFVFECPEDIDEEDEYAYEEACQEAWEEAESEKMGKMSVSELAEYLEDRYGLDTDTSDMEFRWTLTIID